MQKWQHLERRTRLRSCSRGDSRSGVRIFCKAGLSPTGFPMKLSRGSSNLFLQSRIAYFRYVIKCFNMFQKKTRLTHREDGQRQSDSCVSFLRMSFHRALEKIGKVTALSIILSVRGNAAFSALG